MFREKITELYAEQTQEILDDATAVVNGGLKVITVTTNGVGTLAKNAIGLGLGAMGIASGVGGVVGGVVASAAGAYTEIGKKLDKADKEMTTHQDDINTCSCCYYYYYYYYYIYQYQSSEFCD